MMLLRTLPLLAMSALLVAAPARADDIPETARTDTSGKLPDGLDLKPSVGDGPVAIERVVSWNEGDGAHVAVFATREKTGQKGGETFWSRTLFVSTFVKSGDRFKVVRDVKEVMGPCNLDLNVKFLPATIGVTNLDGDAKGELTFAYVTRCAGDVSPSEMKLLVLEGKDKYILRGTTKVDIGGGQIEGGSYKADFGKAPPVFLEHAKRVWDANVGP